MVCNFIKKETLGQVFSWEFWEISKNTFFTEHLWTTASVLWNMKAANKDTKAANKEMKETNKDMEEANKEMPAVASIKAL